ncbi:type 1 glutamine amidotransferase domain-containing protein [Aliikangiella marina]|uniref:Type 1 glutamine amidotransferase domain-containing protein n=1 Tax=Aliikangiella marina TaxID=1712262 RepID=A0A545T5F1_9GAMM|nr:type 1 glutamine amidotransferase domain-containing protein [Aliikangiella marina]TQV72392.1 type 1 glutamine amidotransferase domain-containing protein [Aliikangiella marina]
MKLIKRILLGIFTLTLVFVGLGFGFFQLIDDGIDFEQVRSAKADDIDYIRTGLLPTRGKILAVVTSINAKQQAGFTTGYELTELARPYWVFKANGFEVDIASTLGGEPPVVIDGDDMTEYDFAFLNDPVAQKKVKNSLKIELVNPDDYEAIFFVGGKGTMWDFPDNKTIQSIVKNYYQNDKIIGAVCHGPAALVNVILDNGQPLVAGKSISSFTNSEEIFLKKDAKEVFPFLLESKLIERGARFEKSPNYLEQVSRDGNIITGQNPWSTWKLAEQMIVALGYKPVPRPITGEEISADILLTYEKFGYKAAKDQLEQQVTKDQQPVSRLLIGMHVIVAGMGGEVGKSFDLIALLMNI